MILKFRKHEKFDFSKYELFDDYIKDLFGYNYYVRLCYVQLLNENTIIIKIDIADIDFANIVNLIANDLVVGPFDYRNQFDKLRNENSDYDIKSFVIENYGNILDQYNIKIVS